MKNLKQADIIENTFAISAMGRSGTKFLATLFNNKSNKFTVLHEPREFIAGLVPSHNIEPVIKRFLYNKQRFGYYGEVNSYLRFALPNLPVVKKLYIIRHPFSIVKSTYNWKKGNEIEVIETIHIIETGLRYMMNSIRAGSIKFRYFEDMINDPNVVNDIAKYVGIDDFKCNSDDLKILVNHSTTRLVTSFEELPLKIQKITWDKLQFFIEYFYKPIYSSNMNKSIDNYMETIHVLERSW